MAAGSAKGGGTGPRKPAYIAGIQETAPGAPQGLPDSLSNGDRKRGRCHVRGCGRTTAALPLLLRDGRRGAPVRGAGDILSAGQEDHTRNAGRSPAALPGGWVRVSAVVRAA